MKQRRAAHAGTWYSEDRIELENQFNSWFENLNEELQSKHYTRAIISPHAGYQFSGPTAACGFEKMKNVSHSIKRVFILGPSHCYPLNGCALTTFSSWLTPFGPVNVDQEVISNLKKSEPGFSEIPSNFDEKEHSLELQLPFVKFLTVGQDIMIIPILVGYLDSTSCHLYAESLTPYLEQEDCFFVISSDFCHWGERFNFTHLDQSPDLPIYKNIESMDRKGMDVIETLDPDSFRSYLQVTKNTICGRFPILLFLTMAEILNLSGCSLKFKFTSYKQSNRVMSQTDSSVCYASGFAFFEE